jgi:hypothetical protein
VTDDDGFHCDRFTIAVWWAEGFHHGHSVFSSPALPSMANDSGLLGRKSVHGYSPSTPSGGATNAQGLHYELRRSRLHSTMHPPPHFAFLPPHIAQFCYLLRMINSRHHREHMWFGQKLIKSWCSPLHRCCAQTRLWCNCFIQTKRMCFGHNCFIVASCHIILEQSAWSYLRLIRVSHKILRISWP